MSQPAIRLLVNSKEDFAHKSSSLPWLIEGFLPAGVVTGVVGAPLSGKSSLAFHLAKAVGVGEGFAGRKLHGTARKVLWISAEDGWAAEMQERGERGWSWLDVVPEESVNLLMPSDNDRLDFVQWWGKLADEMNKAGDYGLVVVDHLLGFLTSRSSEGIDRPQSMGPFLTALGQLARSTGCAVVLIHHENKSGGTMGSVNFGVRTRGTIAVRRNKRTGGVSVSVEGNRISPYTIRFKTLLPHTYELISGSDSVVGEVAEVSVRTVKSGDKLAAIRADVEGAPEGLSTRALAVWLRDNCAYTESERTLTRYLKSL